jgi:raffinose/stachyose/melibiose transport system permease protein
MLDEGAGMVGNKAKAKATFALFVLPALGLYLFFAILPLFQGFWLSTTNWDGAAPWTPAQMPIAQFESKVLGKLKSDSDKAFLLKYYVKDEGQGTYRKLEVYGIDRYRVMGIFKSAGYVNPDFQDVGLKNYVDIFTGKIDRRFFPERYRESRFQLGDPIDKLALIPADEFRRNVLSHVPAREDLDYLKGAFAETGEGYALDPALAGSSELDIQSALSVIPGLEDDWEGLFNDALALGSEGKRADLDSRIASVPAVAAGKISASDRSVLASAARKAYDLGRLKGLMSRVWYQDRLKLGVLLFTGLFVVFNVALVNLLGLLLALALDTKMKTRNLLRSIFFIPNVLSMIIVAFIWQLVFRELLPAITPIKEWMMNPDLAPWITILVAVWQGVGYYTVIYLAGLQNIPQDIIESAALDGASGAKRFTKIVLPLLVPAITICLFLSIAGALKTFDIIFALYPSNSTAIGIDNITVNIFFDAFRDRHAGLATAKAILLLVVIAAITGTQLVLTKRKEVEM